MQTSLLQSNQEKAENGELLVADQARLELNRLFGGYLLATEKDPEGKYDFDKIKLPVNVAIDPSTVSFRPDGTLCPPELDEVDEVLILPDGDMYFKPPWIRLIDN